MADREGVVARARACVGVRFRAHGRDPAWGLDCAGLAAVAFGRAVPARYPLRGGTPAAVGALAVAAGLKPRTPDAAGPGDLVLVEGGAGQLHLLVLVPGGCVHADAALRRVVERPGRTDAPVLGAWGED